MDWAWADFVENNLYYLASLPFFYLTWASGYVGMLVRSARTRRWGLTLLWPSRYPKIGGAGDWEASK